MLSIVDNYRVRRVFRKLKESFSNPDRKVRKSFPEEETDVICYFHTSP